MSFSQLIMKHVVERDGEVSGEVFIGGVCTLQHWGVSNVSCAPGASQYQTHLFAEEISYKNYLADSFQLWSPDLLWNLTSFDDYLVC